MNKTLLLLGIFLLSAFSECAAQDTLKVISYNIFNAQDPNKNGGSTLQGIANFISDEEPDFVALQEVDSATHRLAKLNGDRYFNLADSLAKLTNMYSNFGKAIAFDGGSYGIAVLSRRPVATQKIALPNPKLGEPRVLLTADSNTNSGKKVTLAATHLDHQHKENRLQQVDAINKILSTKKEVPIVLAGDFNFGSNTKAYQKMQKYWMDTALNRDEKPEFTYPTETPTRRIDYVWVAPPQRWEVLSYRTPELPYSDHLPVVTKLVLYE